MLSEKLLELYNNLLLEHSGIFFPEHLNKTLSRRITSRINILKIESPEVYLDLLRVNNKELLYFLDHVTTNLTYFYRQKKHYEVLERLILPELAERQHPLRLWSAGCATGEEPYTMAILLHSVLPESFSFHIHATDISQTCIETAKRGIYQAHQLSALPAPLRTEYLEKCSRTEYRVVDHLKKYITFSVHSLSESDYQTVSPLPFDIVFCRNVLIYFPEEVQQNVVCKIGRMLKTDGYLFIGGLEYIHNMDIPFVLTDYCTTIYQKTHDGK